MSRAEYMTWEEFYSIEPWGLAVQDSMFAQIVQILANANRDSKKHPAPYTLGEFLLYQERPLQAPADSAVLLDDPNAQTELLIAAQFGAISVIRADKAQ